MTNDGELGALAEHTRVSNVVFVVGDVGVGGGVIPSGAVLPARAATSASSGT